jgi:hypothetical protein
MVFDKNGKEIKKGVTIKKLYIDPMGRLTDEIDLDFPETKIVLEFQTLGFWNKYDEYESIFSYLDREKGEYIPNYGNKTIIHNKASTLVVVSN